MNARRSIVGLALLGMLGWAASCRFEPNLSRFAECGDDGACPTGHTCLAEARRCLPDCGAQGPCSTEPPDDAVDAGSDAGPDTGPDAGEPLSLITNALPVGLEQVTYKEELRARGGRPPYTFRALEPLPPRLTLDGGTLSGTPSTPGTFQIAVEVSDQDSPPARASKAYPLRIRPLLRLAGPPILADGYLREPYTEQVFATGGTPPYRFSLEPGTPMPEGFALDPDGGVSGVPSDAGPYSFQVKVTDSDSIPQTAVRSLSLDISMKPLFLTLSTRSVPDGRVGTPYHYVLRATGSSSSPTWKLKAGNTPEGIGFDATTSTLRGTPTKPGAWSFTISVEDGLNTDERTFLLSVY
jgi:hypothetical protein